MTIKKDDEKENNHLIDLHVGMRMKDRRHKIGMTLESLSEKLGLSLQQIHKYEQAESRMGASILYKVAKILGVEPDYFFEGIEPILPAMNVPQDDQYQVCSESFNLLILEDDPNEELLLRSIIDQQPIATNVHVVHTSHQALEILSSKESSCNLFKHTDLFLANNTITKKEGINILRSIKYNHHIKEIPVVIIANTFSRLDMIDSYKNYCNGYIYKNGNTKIFETKIVNMLNYWASCVCATFRN